MTTLSEDARSVFALTITPEQAGLFDIYAKELVDWNTRVNLTSITDAEGVRIKHFLDSLSCLQLMKSHPVQRVVDVGTGAGFPGIPIKIVLPNMRLTLLEAVGKKKDFCQHVINMLELPNVEVIHGRAEDLARDPCHRESYDWALARAVAELPVLAEYLLPFVKIDGYMLAQKGESGPVEAQNAAEAIQLLGGVLEKIVPVELPGIVETRYLVLVRKIARTPERFPRRPGTAAKNPLSRKLPARK